MNACYVDAHCHVQLPDYDVDRETVIERMKSDGIAGIVVGVDYETSRDAVLLAEKHEHLFASVALHPSEAATSFDIRAFEELAQHPRTVAIGECGLDYFRLPAHAEGVPEMQKALFQKHLALARTVGKPLMIHARPSKGTNDAYRDTLALLAQEKRENPALSGNVHFFVGGISEMQSFAALGFSVSFTAVITFTHDYDAVIAAAPESMILSETDAPFVAPASRRGSRNDPLAVIDVVHRIAEVRDTDTETIRIRLLKNAISHFSLPLGIAP